MAAVTERESLIYRGKPLIRDGNVLYFGDFNENFITRFTILDSEKVNDLDMARKITIGKARKRYFHRKAHEKSRAHKHVGGFRHWRLLAGRYFGNGKGIFKVTGIRIGRPPAELPLGAFFLQISKLAGA